MRKSDDGLICCDASSLLAPSAPSMLGPPQHAASRGDSDALPTEAGPPNRISALDPQVARKPRTPSVASWRKIDWISSAE